mgnify:CR=1 FL=1
MRLTNLGETLHKHRLPYVSKSCKALELLPELEW